MAGVIDDSVVKLEWHPKTGQARLGRFVRSDSAARTAFGGSSLTMGVARNRLTLSPCAPSKKLVARYLFTGLTIL